MAEAEHWSTGVHERLRAHRFAQVAYVPDAGHKRLIELCRADASMRAVALTTEEEGVGLAAGAWLGGARAALLMQSSGVGNIVNALAMTRECRFPLVMLVTMRGEYGEFNPWQVPMGQAVPAVLAQMGVLVRHVEDGGELPGVVDACIRLAYSSYAAVAVLVGQRLVGIKTFQEQAAQ
jgi:sulfopyruvate decarboxylase alpha subunit